LVNPVTGGACGCYEKGETWDGVFGRLASGYEECRAECCGLYLSLDRTVLNIFGHTEEDEQNDISYINWLLMCRAGIVALEYYTPETKAWRQAHMNARYVILRVLIEAGEGLVQIIRKDGADGKPDIEVQLDRTKLHTVGRAAIGRFLLKLQVHKSTANLAEGGALFEEYSVVDDDMLQLRTIVMDRKEPRRLLLQPNLVVEAGSVTLRGYPSTPAGLVQSYLDRFQHLDLAALCEAAELEAPFVDDLEYFSG
jgi:dipeptidyl-peptidase-3